MTLRRSAIPAAMMLLVAWGTACSPERIVDNAPLPPDVADPGLTKTPAGAVAAYHGTLSLFNSAFAANVVNGLTQGSFVVASGVISDELQDGSVGEPISVFTARTPLDSRVAPECPYGVPTTTCNEDYYGVVYSALQGVRANASEARGLLTHYAPDSLRALTGHLYALTAYTETFLADLYCSGVPLSTIDFEGNYTLKPGSSTDEVYQHALLFFDSALTLAADSERIMNLARVGKGRVLLDLGQYAAAAQAVAEVPNDFAYREFYTATSAGGTSTPALLNFAYYQAGSRWEITVADTEGHNGLDYRSSRDPRTASTALATKNGYGVTLYHPDKYATSGVTPVVVASGIEARLIEAEAALNAGDASWLDKLNALRTDGTFDTQPSDTNPAVTDTLWHAGIGGVAGLRPLGDPSTPDARVDLLFRERAFWLFLTGHRQGDLRRLVRNYGRVADAVYPTGRYAGGSGSYGSDVTVPIPARERQGNPLFTGCLNRGA
ncbi:MAG: hypothetical protein IRY91_05105 [Gemmatimonadaceae bacterium]|nr:hypothetical protein [Gemmatimonadaceae bacterium]